jgi:hypothetical protein
MSERETLIIGELWLDLQIRRGRSTEMSLTYYDKIVYFSVALSCVLGLIFYSVTVEAMLELIEGPVWLAYLWLSLSVFIFEEITVLMALRILEGSLK